MITLVSSLLIFFLLVLAGLMYARYKKKDLIVWKDHIWWTSNGTFHIKFGDNND